MSLINSDIMQVEALGSNITIETLKQRVEAEDIQFIAQNQAVFDAYRIDTTASDTNEVIAAAVDLIQQEEQVKYFDAQLYKDPEFAARLSQIINNHILPIDLLRIGNTEHEVLVKGGLPLHNDQVHEYTSDVLAVNTNVAITGQGNYMVEKVKINLAKFSPIEQAIANINVNKQFTPNGNIGTWLHEKGHFFNRTPSWSNEVKKGFKVSPESILIEKSEMDRFICEILSNITQMETGTGIFNDKTLLSKLNDSECYDYISTVVNSEEGKSICRKLLALNQLGEGLGQYSSTQLAKDMHALVFERVTEKSQPFEVNELFEQAVDHLFQLHFKQAGLAEDDITIQELIDLGYEASLRRSRRLVFSIYTGMKESLDFKFEDPASNKPIEFKLITDWVNGEKVFYFKNQTFSDLSKSEDVRRNLGELIARQISKFRFARNIAVDLDETQIQGIVSLNEFVKKSLSNIFRFTRGMESTFEEFRESIEVDVNGEKTGIEVNFRPYLDKYEKDERNVFGKPVKRKIQRVCVEFRIETANGNLTNDNFQILAEKIRKVANERFVGYNFILPTERTRYFIDDEFIRLEDEAFQLITAEL